MIKKILLMGVLTICLLAGCGKESTSFEEEYTQQNFNEQADEVAESVGEEVEDVKRRVQEEDEQIQRQAKDVAGSLSSDARQEFEEGLEQMDEWQDTDMNPGEVSMYYSLKFYYFVRELTPVLIAISWFTAIILYIISSGNKRRRSLAVFGFGIGFPVVLFMIRYVIPWIMLLF